MSFKKVLPIILAALFVLLTACSDKENEVNLVNLHVAAQQDIVSINFPVDTIETVLSINSEFDFSLQGLKSQTQDVVTLSKNVQWSLSENASSTIDKNGHFIASANAEIITLSARFGHLVESIEIRVSSAVFDRVVEFSNEAFSIDMCQSQNIKPVGRYVDEDGNEEIRPVDSTIINTIEWLVRNQEDNVESQRAHIETSGNQATVRTLSAGNIVIQAKALSILTGNVETSIDFEQAIGSDLNSIKLCDSSDIDLLNCNLDTTEIEKDKTLSLISVGTYQAIDGSSLNTNISNNSKWGIENTNATIALSGDRQQLNITGDSENTSAIISVACGDIVESIVDNDITKGVVLKSSVTCDNNIDCLEASQQIKISPLAVTSLKVTANGNDLTDGQSLTLSGNPAEVTLIVTAVFSNNSSQVITEDSNLAYSITLGNNTVIVEKAGLDGVYTVNSFGTAEIKLDFSGESFLAVIVTAP